MKANLISTIVLILALFIQFAVPSVVTAYGASDNPICSSPESLSLEKKDLATALTIDYSTTYYTEEGDSAPLWVKKGSGATGWKFFYSVDNKFTSFANKECSGTGSYTFVALISRALVLLDGSTYKICRFDPGTTVSTFMVTLNPIPTNTVTGTIKDVSFFYLSDVMVIYVSVSDGTDSAIYNFDISSSTPGSNPDAAASSNFLFYFRSKVRWKGFEIPTSWKSNVSIRCCQSSGLSTF